MYLHIMKHLIHFLLYLEVNYYETINQLIFHEPCSLDTFKSLTEKQKLLEAAVFSCDSDAIIAVRIHLFDWCCKLLTPLFMQVILFLRRTLTRSLFIEQITQKSQPGVVNQYISYLRQSGEFDELQSIYLCV